ncbi:MAG: hypothetical protein AAFR76_15530 [Planctomycetota bacterium]
MVRTTQIEPQPFEDAVPPRSEAWLPNILLAAAVVLLIVVVLGKSRRTAIAKSHEVLPTPQERLAELRHRAENDAGIEARAANAADQIRELTAVLDTRIETLDVLIQQADDRIAQLSSTPAVSPTPHAHGHPAGHHAAAPDPGDSGKQAIFELADQGHTPAEIAARLGQHAGKVELILALRRV